MLKQRQQSALTNGIRIGRGITPVRPSSRPRPYHRTKLLHSRTVVLAPKMPPGRTGPRTDFTGRLHDSQRSSLQCAHGDGPTRTAARTRGVSAHTELPRWLGLMAPQDSARRDRSGWFEAGPSPVGQNSGRTSRQPSPTGQRKSLT